MKIKSKIFLFLFFFLFLFLFSNNCNAVEISYSSLTFNNISYNDIKDLNVGTLYFNIGGTSSYYSCFAFIPMYIDQDNNNAIINYYYNDGFNSSNGVNNLDLNSFNRTMYFYNGNKVNNGNECFLNSSSLNNSFKVRDTITWFYNGLIYNFSVTSVGTTYADISYCGGLNNTNDSLDYILGSRIIMFYSYNPSSNTRTKIYDGWTESWDFHFNNNNKFSGYDLNSYYVVPLTNTIYCQYFVNNNVSNYNLFSFNYDSSSWVSSDLDFALFNSSFYFNNDNDYGLTFDYSSQLFPIIPINFPSVTKNVSFVFDDYNLMKRFKYNVDLPLYSQYSKYFAFLKNVNRVSGNEVYLTLDIYIIDLQDNYIMQDGYQDIFNWLMYDNQSKCFVFPFGMRLKHLTAIGKNNNTMTTILVSDTITTRIDSNQSIMNKLVSDLNSDYSATSPIPTTKILSSNYIGSLVNQAFLDFESLNVPLIGDIFAISPLDNIQDFIRSGLVNFLYYSTTDIQYTMDDFLFGNYYIISYEHTYKQFTSVKKYYELFNYTKTYSTQNTISNDNFYLGFYDNNDLSNLSNLPSNYNYVDNLYVNLPSNIFYNITDLSDRSQDTYNYNDNIDYNLDDNNFNGVIPPLIIDNLDNSNDNDSINNSYQITIDNLKDYSPYLRDIINLLTTIKGNTNLIVKKMSKSVPRATKEVNDLFNLLITPDDIDLQNSLDTMNDTFQQLYGVIHDPFYLFRQFAINIREYDDDDMSLVIPQLTIMNYTILEQTTFDFNEFFYSDSNLTYALFIIRLFGDFWLTSFLFLLIINTYKGVMRDDY